ncbi:unnamed protein product [Dovyalis caffra]|uniref:Uncharacterized protein n=1 Tax=Dovyalis caffra TaxID=77055 RepID=A0AAV1RD10_9ROSI|nr:unnamed protein product [Dovyalis caffra]
MPTSPFLFTYPPSSSSLVLTRIVVGANLLGLSERPVLAKKASLVARNFMDAVRTKKVRANGFAKYMVNDMGMGVDVVEESEDERLPILPSATLGK